jgi:hypothetical protein
MVLGPGRLAGERNQNEIGLGRALFRGGTMTSGGPSASRLRPLSLASRRSPRGRNRGI